MKYLLDTHALLWAIISDDKLSKKAAHILHQPENEILVSSISFWEISLKFSLKKLRLIDVQPDDFPAACLKMGFSIVNMNAEDSSTYHQLSAKYHKDPFDRMLIWTAIRNNYIFISKDENAKKYESEGLKVMW